MTRTGTSSCVSFLIDTSDQLASIGESETSARVRDAGASVGMPSEWMEDAGFALRDALRLSTIPPSFAAEMESTLAAIRQGFRAAGTDPIF